MTNTTISPDPLINAFAAAVRAELADLPDEDVDDLTGGLVADLTEQAADDGVAFDPGDPVAYARELRTAAGLPERASAPPRVTLGQRIDAWEAQMASRFRATRFGAWLLDLLAVLRPVWWVARGILLYFVATTIVTPYSLRDFSPVRFVMLLGIVLVSVQWGRGKWLPQNGLRHVRTLASVVAVLAILPAVTIWGARDVQYVNDGSVAPSSGLLLDGAQVGNLFAYDEEGKPIEHVQLFTDHGTPLNLYGGDSTERDAGDLGAEPDSPVTVPARDLLNQVVWNVYPLQVGRLNDDGTVESSTVRDPAAPYQRVPTPVTSGGAEPTPEPTSVASEGPTSSPTPSTTPTR